MVIHLLTLMAVFQAVTQSILREEEGEANPSSFLFLFLFFLFTFGLEAFQLVNYLICYMCNNLVLVFTNSLHPKIDLVQTTPSAMSSSISFLICK